MILCKRVVGGEGAKEEAVKVSFRVNQHGAKKHSAPGKSTPWVYGANTLLMMSNPVLSLLEDRMYNLPICVHGDKALSPAPINLEAKQKRKAMDHPLSLIVLPLLKWL